MKKTFIFLVIFFCIMISQKTNIIFANQKQEVVHFFTHELIYDTHLAYSPTNPIRKCFDRDHLTATEFLRFLEQMHKNNYVLVDIDDIYERDYKKLVYRTQANFNGRKPLLLSFDDLTYDTKGKGIVEKVVFQDGEILDFASAEEQKYSQARDCITILESYINRHPDFSYNNARAILCVNGYNGILGYRIQRGSLLSQVSLQEEKTKLSELCQELKRRGYKFANHSFSHLNCAYSSYSTMLADIKKWQTEIQTFTGNTNIFCFPGGSHICPSRNIELLKQNGFDTFLCVGRDLKKKSEQEDATATYIYRFPLDGTALRVYEKEYSDFFNSFDIYDTGRYLPFSYKKGY